MKYLISENKLMNVMEKFFHMNYPDIELPLETKRIRGIGNRGYGSRMDDYTYINVEYFDQNGEKLFTEYDDNYTSSDVKWDVSDIFESIFNYFGEQAFEEFVKYYFNLDITKKNNKKDNWFFC